MQTKISISFSLIFVLLCITSTECRSFTKEDFLKYHADLFPREKYGGFVDVLNFLSKQNQFSRMLKILTMLDVKNRYFGELNAEIENEQILDLNNYQDSETPKVGSYQKRRTFFVGK